MNVIRKAEFTVVLEQIFILYSNNDEKILGWFHVLFWVVSVSSWDFNRHLALLYSMSAAAITPNLAYSLNHS